LIADIVPGGADLYLDGLSSGRRWDEDATGSDPEPAGIRVGGASRRVRLATDGGNDDLEQ